MPLVVLLALAPALVSWWTGRGVLARADDPALPEILLERRRRLGIITLAGAVAIVVLAESELYWALPVLWIALLVSGYPVRRALFSERWSLPAFLRYAISSGIGQMGWRLLVPIGPVVAVASAFAIDPSGGPTAVRGALWLGGAFAVVILVWQQFYARVWLDLHRATPLRAGARPELVARLDEILDRARLTRRPEVYRFGAPGGHFVNALAIPSLHAPAVALSDGLLAALTDDEVVAVFAHEVAHHEQFTPRRLRLGAVAGVVLALFSIALPLGFVTIGPGAAALTAGVFCVAIIVALGKRAPSRRDSETASDLRAAELTGDAESVARALTKVHLSNRVPRRWPHAIENAATHPSLARRIQALRALAPATSTIAVTIAAPLAWVRSARGDTVVVIEPARAHWFEGVAAETSLELDALRAAASSYRALAYADLVELRVGAAGNERTLNAVDRRGAAWSVPVAASDVPALQAALDTVDVKLGARPTPLRPANIATARLLAIAALVTLAVSGEAGVALIPILFVLFRPTLTAAVAAAGAIALGRAIVALTTFVWIDTSRQMSVVGALAAAVALLVVAAMRTRADERRDARRRPPREAMLLALILGCLSIVFALGALSPALARAGSLLSSPVAISAATTLAGIGAALATMAGRWRRIGGSATTIAAVAGATLLAGNGSLYNRSAALTWTTARLVPAGTAMVPGGVVTSLDVSPNGESYTVAQYRAARRGVPTNRYLIGRFGEGALPPHASDALQLAFADDRTLLAIEARGTDSLEIRAEGVSAAGDSSAAAPVLWRQSLPPIEMPRLLVDRQRRLWVVLGRGEDYRDVVVVTGTFDGGVPRSYRWSGDGPESSGEVMAQPLAGFGDGTAIWSTIPGLRDPMGALGPMMMLMASNPRWELRSSGPAGERVLADFNGLPSCASEVDARGVVCAERTANRTRLWRVGASKAVPVADLPAALSAIHPLGAARVAAIERFGTRMAIVDAEAHRGIRLTLPTAPVGRWTSDIAVAGEYVLVMETSRNFATLSRYKIR